MKDPIDSSSRRNSTNTSPTFGISFMICLPNRSQREATAIMGARA
jgi:hypothetical protein